MQSLFDKLLKPAQKPSFDAKVSRTLQHLVDFINREAETQVRQVLDLWRQPVGVRVQEAEAIAGLRVREITPNRAVLAFEQNASKFRPGDQLRLNLGNPFEAPSVGCVLEEEQDHTLVLTPGFRQTFAGLPASAEWVLDRDKVDVRRVQLETLEELERSEHRQRIFDTFGGRLDPGIDPQLFRQAEAHAAQLGMNPSQVEAFASASAAWNTISSRAVPSPVFSKLCGCDASNSRLSPASMSYACPPTQYRIDPSRQSTNSSPGCVIGSPVLPAPGSTVTSNGSSCWFCSPMPRLCMRMPLPSVVSRWSRLTKTTVSSCGSSKKSVIFTPSAVASACSDDTVGEFSPRSMRLMAFTDSVQRSASARSESPCRSRSARMRGPTFGTRLSCISAAFLSKYARRFYYNS